MIVTSSRRGCITFAYPLKLLRVCMAFHTIHSSTSGHPELPSSLQTACFIFSEGGAPPTLTTTPIKRNLFHAFPLLKFYCDFSFSVGLVGIVPYAGTGFLTWDYIRAATTPRFDFAGRASPAHNAPRGSWY